MQSVFAETDIRAEAVGCGSEVAHLVKLAVIWDVLLGNGADCLASVNDHCAVTELAADCQWHPDYRNNVEGRGLINDTGKLGLCRSQERFLQEQVAAGITCDRQLRKANYLHPPAVSLFDKLDDPIRVKFAVCDLELRRGAGDLYKSVLHSYPSTKKALRSRDRSAFAL